MMTDPIADLLTRIRNAARVERPFVDVPFSKMKLHIVEALEREGYVWEHQVIEQQPVDQLRVSLKYGPNGEQLIQHLKRISKPGRRVYVGVGDVREIRQGTGIGILSTSHGVLSSREARKEGVGGEMLCEVW